MLCCLGGAEGQIARDDCRHREQLEGEVHRQRHPMRKGHQQQDACSRAAGGEEMAAASCGSQLHAPPSDWTGAAQGRHPQP